MHTEEEAQRAAHRASRRAVPVREPKSGSRLRDMQRYVTTRKAAEALGVSEASVKRWCDQGKLVAVRTAGGHRRVRVSSIHDYVERSRLEFASPEILGLSGGAREARAPGDLTASSDALLDALQGGDIDAARRIVCGLRRAGVPLASSFDRVVAPAFTEIGCRWETGSVEVYEERRACRICGDLLHELRLMIPPANELAPVALGATLSNDHYSIASTMAELVLRDLGWRAETLGVNLPAESLAAAIRSEKPKLVWMSVSHIADPEGFLREFAVLAEAAENQRASLAIGGRALDEKTRQSLRYTVFCDRMENLEAFARSLFP